MDKTPTSGTALRVDSDRVEFTLEVNIAPRASDRLPTDIGGGSA